MTPTARSMKWLRDRGWIVCRVEQRLHVPGATFPITRDAFNFGDLLAALPEGKLLIAGSNGTTWCDPQIALVQVTSGSNHNARKAKIAANRDAKKWKAAGGSIFLHSWAKRGPRGKRKKFVLREEVL